MKPEKWNPKIQKFLESKLAIKMNKKTETIETLHYNGDVTIQFYPNSHRYRVKGERSYLIGVTTATGMIDKSRPLLIWAGRLTEEYLMAKLKAGEPISERDIKDAVMQREVKLEESGDTGTAVHDWCEKYIKGQNPEVPEDQRVRNGVLAFLRWVEEHGIKFVESEVRVYSRKHGYVGTMDTIYTKAVENHGILHPGDFKTGSGVYMDQAFQVSGYQGAYTEEHGTEFGSKGIMRFVKEDKFKDGVLVQRAGDFEFKEFDAEEHEEHFKGFLAALELKKQNKVWERAHGYYANR